MKLSIYLTSLAIGLVAAEYDADYIRGLHATYDSTALTSQEAISRLSKGHRDLIGDLIPGIEDITNFIGPVILDPKKRRSKQTVAYTEDLERAKEIINNVLKPAELLVKMEKKVLKGLWEAQRVMEGKDAMSEEHAAVLRVTQSWEDIAADAIAMVGEAESDLRRLLNRRDIASRGGRAGLPARPKRKPGPKGKAYWQNGMAGPQGSAAGGQGEGGQSDQVVHIPPRLPAQEVYELRNELLQHAYNDPIYEFGFTQEQQRRQEQEQRRQEQQQQEDIEAEPAFQFFTRAELETLEAGPAQEKQQQRRPEKDKEAATASEFFTQAELDALEAGPGLVARDDFFSVDYEVPSSRLLGGDDQFFDPTLEGGKGKSGEDFFG